MGKINISEPSGIQIHNQPELIAVALPTELQGYVDDFSLSVWVHFLSRAFAQKVSFRIFIQHFNLSNVKTMIYDYYSAELILLVTLSLTR